MRPKYDIFPGSLGARDFFECDEVTVIQSHQHGAAVLREVRGKFEAAATSSSASIYKDGAQTAVPEAHARGTS